MRLIGPQNVLLSSDNWLSKIFEFKAYLKNSTQFQLIDNFIYWHCNSSIDLARPYLAVIGTANSDEREFSVVDLPESSFWTKSIKNLRLMALEGDFDTLKHQIQDLLVDIPPELDKTFHLVMGEEKIELHFFLQKDYIG